MEVVPQVAGESATPREKHFSRNRRNDNRSSQRDPSSIQADPSAGASTANQESPGNPTNRQPRRPRNLVAQTRDQSFQAGPSSSGADNSSTSAAKPRNPRRRGPPKAQAGAVDEGSADLSTKDHGAPRNAGKPPSLGDKEHNSNRRGGKFNAGLTDSKSGVVGDTSILENAPLRPSDRYKNRAPRNFASSKVAPSPVADDLASTLVRALSTPPYPDCLICFSSIHPAQPVWSCSPSIPVIGDTTGESTPQQYCWNNFHVKCIRSWAAKSVKEVADAWHARGDEGHRGDWRCPGCQAKREIVPAGYWCFCNSTPEPRLTRLATPHSCGSLCSRPRSSGCGHPCPLQCHPGPCPPCQVTTRLPCYCPRGKVLAFRCGVGSSLSNTGQDGANNAHGQARDLSCGEVCGRTLSCGKHQCQQVCHAGDCEGCTVKEQARCWCGKEEREVGCGVGEEVQCLVLDGGKEERWVGRFGCEEACARPFDCGIHKCKKACHPPSPIADPCPRSPSLITHCACGRHRVAPASLSSILSTSSEYTFPARVRCTDPIPTCNSPCSKALPSCSHSCAAKCHTGPCPPCSVSIVRPCRCGGTTRGVRCSQIHQGGSEQETEILCDKPCGALRACGRHQCRRVCCPLASLALAAAKKGKKRAGAAAAAGEVGVGEEPGGLHECDLVCGRLLGCGNHTCEEKDHKGVCPPCLRSSFEEMICFCGQTVLEPPIPCGTRMNCTYPCPRPPPPCGHPRTQHSCHEEGIPCPPCPFLAAKACACGKKVVGNVKCSLETSKVSCGTVCGKLMKCGFHHCERLCHGEDCGDCTSVCGKSRKLCLPSHHPCPRPCHAPASCPEDEPCQSLLTLTCPCGRIRQSVYCSRSNTQPKGRDHATPKCSTECSIAKRNARLADALGITAESREKAAAATYNDDVVGFARANLKFVGVVEKAFADFVNADKRTQVLPHMPPDRRKFVHDLAIVYRMDTQMVDQEPHRSVQLIRRVDTGIPAPLLSTYIASSAPAPSLGKLADLRNPNTVQSWRTSASTSAPSSRPSSAQRGWSAAVARPTAQTPVPRSMASLVGAASGNRTDITRTPTPTRQAQTVPEARPVSPRVLQPSEGPVPESWEDDA